MHFALKLKLVLMTPLLTEKTIHATIGLRRIVGRSVGHRIIYCRYVMVSVMAGLPVDADTPSVMFLPLPFFRRR